MHQKFALTYTQLALCHFLIMQHQIIIPIIALRLYILQTTDRRDVSIE